MFDHLQIYNRRERLLVGAADTLLRPYSAAARALAAAPTAGEPARILLLRLERIGDLLMTLGAIETVRTRAQKASIHLVIGGWNAALAPLIRAVDSHETLDVPWLARGSSAMSQGELMRRALAWRHRRFDLAINFEPDIRTNFLLALSGAKQRIGFSSGGGEGFLTGALAYEPKIHTADNALRLVNRALPGDGATPNSLSLGRLEVPDTARTAALTLLGHPSSADVFVGVHPSGGRLVKQWHMERFAEVATRLARDLSATVVLTGTPDDRALVERITSLLPSDVRRLDLTGQMDLQLLAAVLQRLNLFVTSDTGPMHLAAAVRTPTVAIFGPSGPTRYGPLNDRARVVTADLWCRPCNRVRLPPERCTGHVPDCLDRIDVDMVYTAARELT